MTSDQRSFVSKAGLPIALYCGGLAAVCAISAIWGMRDHAFAIDLVAAAFTYSIALSVFFGVLRGVDEADDEQLAPVVKTQEPPHGLRQAA